MVFNVTLESTMISFDIELYINLWFCIHHIHYITFPIIFRQNYWKNCYLASQIQMRLNGEAGLPILYLSPKSNCLKSQGQAVLYESDF